MVECRHGELKPRCPFEGVPVQVRLRAPLLSRCVTIGEGSTGWAIALPAAGCDFAALPEGSSARRPAPFGPSAVRALLALPALAALATWVWAFVRPAGGGGSRVRPFHGRTRDDRTGPRVHLSDRTAASAADPEHLDAARTHPVARFRGVPRRSRHGAGPDRHRRAHPVLPALRRIRRDRAGTHLLEHSQRGAPAGPCLAADRSPGEPGSADTGRHRPVLPLPRGPSLESADSAVAVAARVPIGLGALCFSLFSVVSVLESGTGDGADGEGEPEGSGTAADP